ncbi:3-oxoadipate enol-lactonase [Chitinivorax tropicus]|uniref:3-oxoadipate enol-lactonase n=1 Tax=Chitinivorax tropicus TaxID=714531 RepID=A0A840MS55_9PROT|nr:alpha/beta hydrolase [Chitinivorax tropicus]MBB5019246.1 3-oxoadipate enol-lactonase [Chitinivorax tropicus]
MPLAELNTTELYYELHGNGRDVVVLLNGISMSTAAWGLQVPALVAAGFRVLCYDLRGQWQSGKPQQDAYTMPQHADDLVGLLSHLDIEAAHLVGISYGGAVAQHVAIGHRSRLRKLVLADTLAWSDEVNNVVADTWFAAANSGHPTLRFDVGLAMTFGNTYLRHNPVLIAKMREFAANQPWAPLARLINGMRMHDVRDHLSQIKADTLVIIGEDDRFTPLYHSRLLADRIPSAKLAVIEDCGHASCLERPEAFNKLVLDFLAT